MKTALSQSDDNNLMFVFKFACIEVQADPEVYDEEQIELLNQRVQMLSREITIDKTYVDYEGTKYEKTFMYEDGWNNLCDLVRKTKFGKKASKDEDDQLRESYKAMIVQYILQVLEDLDYDTSHICLSVAENTSFMVEIHKNMMSDNYPGKWQTW